MPKNLVVTCLINFLVAALTGVVLRYAFVGEVGFNFRFLTHAHSHVAMLGWVYLMLYVLFAHFFVPEKKAVFNRLFWLTQLAVVGMMFSFPVQGYAAVSIAFSTLHIFCSYYFVYLIWKHQKTEQPVAEKLLKTSLVFMLISTIGVWCLGPAVSMQGQASAFYQIAIQFFLHFQFNGWFLIAVLAVFFYKLKLEPSPTFKRFFQLLLASTMLTMALPVYWFVPLKIFLWINGLGVLLQLLTLVLLIKLIKPYRKSFIKNNTKLTIAVFCFALVSLVLKMVLQSLSLVPEIAAAAYQQRNLVIGFIHLLMLGAITGFLFGFILQSRLTNFNFILKLSLLLFILGFVLTELLLMLQGVMLYFGVGILSNYFILLFTSSTLLPLGILGITVNILKRKIYGTETS
ncbi:hypothetical protein [Tamlana crocina]|uniref:Cytochrome oxidase subunit I profile domain-containing protein n=1 Tax=Tamlana crocina TaxID=393006 RepID=A0ABX1DCW4_9FLAO|nr:hypothetical protein [Tamlana crocina]NJX14458.1 hypothetical protein [Tamlana crocina]